MALNPVAFTENVVGKFLRYQLTAYPFADERLYDQMRRLLSLDETRLTPLLKGPYLTLSRSFKPGRSIAELVGEGVLHPTLQGIASYPGLYGHQEKAIRAIRAGRTTLVATGTGSGKTECFLYPIISRCFELKDQKAGIVAVLVYPMNALAEDQLGRLRELLAGTGITFGLYVGKTPDQSAAVAGERLRQGASREDYRRALRKAQDERRGTAVHPVEERCSREEMRTPGSQPRILLTNVKQLELLLTRQSDEALFEGARLEYMVFDEAHTFSGAAGAETACLVRRLRAFCGRGAADTVCIGTSATIADPERGRAAGQEFAARFFGVDAAQAEVVGEEYEEDDWSLPRQIPPPLPGDAGEHLSAVLKAVDATSDGAGALNAALVAMGQDALPQVAWDSALHDRLSRNEIAYQMTRLLSRPQRLGQLLEDLRTRLGRGVSAEEALTWLALGASARKDGRPLLRPVVHAFVSGVSGAIVTFPRKATEPRLWLSAEDAAAGDDKLVRLPVTTCSTCGQHYFVHHLADFFFTDKAPGGGEASGDRVLWRPLDPTLGGKRLVLVDRVIAADDEDDDDPPRTARVFLCRACGALHPAAVECCDACSEPQLVELLAMGQKEQNPGYLTRCVSCGATGRSWGSGYREPARPVRAVTVSDVHVLAQEMVNQAERRRLLVFADNRQDAAFQAGWMRDHARRFRLRALMAERLAQGPVTAGDLVAHLETVFDADNDLSRSIAPEVWNVATKDAAPQQHSQERHTFLRIQVLRELATGIKQRIGLEPWGRLRVEYAGLNAEAAFVKSHAATLGVSPELLAHGIAALLDRFRRSMHLLDREGGVFSRFWDDGDREILFGYMPKMPGVPKGLKLERAGGDDAGRVSQWLSERGDTAPRQVARGWGVPSDDVADFVRDLWAFLTGDLKLLAPVTLKGSRGGALPACGGVRQIDADRLTLVPHRGRWRCRRCRRSQPRPAPLDRCLAWRCDGTLQFVEEDPDNYDLALLDGNVAMLRPREHSAQVPADEREFLERAFKGETEAINTLVCTPTLEMGVDIGALDTVLMRNVPPLPANYWQRSGRAGRRHRMAVNVTYARNMSHDRTYFTEPLRMLTGAIEPPRFNLRNELMVRKHVHATVLTRLGQLKRADGLSEFDRAEIADTLKTVLPPQIRQYLFDDAGQVRSKLYDVSALRTLVTKHETDLVAHISAAFLQGWPVADADVVAEERIRAYVGEMPDELERVVRALRKRLDWALDQIRRLQEVQTRQGALEPEQEALRGRCERLVKRYKGQTWRQKREAEGVDDIATFNVLAAEGFLPGYGLEIGAVVATAQVPRQLQGLGDFDLGRAPSMAVREFVPGNLIYANGHRFTPRHYHLSTEAAQPVAFQVDVPSQSVLELGGMGGVAGVSAAMLRAVPISDVDLPHMSHISDEEEFRFQVPVAVYGYDQGRHGGGRAYRWGDQDVLVRRSVHLRLVNIGAASLLDGGRLGYDVCIVCGQSRSPFSSLKEREKFAKDHRERCGQSVAPTGFYADVVADALSLPTCDDRETAYSLLEALRIGASKVLDMEREDLEILVIGQAGTPQVDALLYDPMPGGSGLLEQLCTRFKEVCEAAIEVVARCPSACERACIDCLMIFRNAFFHKHLSRQKAAESLKELGTALTTSHEIPARLPTETPSGAKMPTNEAEARLRELLRRAGFPEPEWQKGIPLGPPHGSTTPDCFFKLDDPSEPGVCVYVDGLSEHIHGNPLTAARDKDIRAQLEARGYVVFSIAATELWDRAAMSKHFFRLGKELLGRDRARDLRDQPGWFDSAQATAGPIAAPTPVVPFRRTDGAGETRFKSCVPLVSLKAAAGLFSDSQDVEVEAWVEPATPHRLAPGMFVAQVVGRSMEPRIPDGAYCLFRGPVTGSRSGRILLVQHRDIRDPETGGSYTVKRYSSLKREAESESWAHDQIRLEPLNPAFKAIVLTGGVEGDVMAVAELLEVLA